MDWSPEGHGNDEESASSGNYAWLVARIITVVGLLLLISGVVVFLFTPIVPGHSLKETLIDDGFLWKSIPFILGAALTVVGIRRVNSSQSV